MQETVDLPPPKRAKSGYLLFTIDRRPTLSKEDPTLKAKEIMKKLGKEWNNLDKEEKKMYNDLAEKDKKRYERQKEEFKRTGKYFDEDGKLPLHDIPEKRKESPGPVINNKKRMATPPGKKGKKK